MSLCVWWIGIAHEPGGRPATIIAVQTEPVTIPGLPAPVTIQLNQWTGKRRLLVDDAEIPTTRRGGFEFVSADGQRIPGRIKTMQVWQAYPEIEFGGSTYKTGPEAPVWLKFVAGLPVLLVVAGLLGAVIGVSAVLANFAVIRSGAGKGTVIATSIGSALLALAIYLTLAYVILEALD